MKKLVEVFILNIYIRFLRDENYVLTIRIVYSPSWLSNSVYYNI